MTRLFRFSAAARRDPAISIWLGQLSGELGGLARLWFEVLRGCGADVRELMHDGCPTACVQDAAFAYVGAYKAHVNVGFFHGNALSDPAGLLEGTGKFMRHVKLLPGTPVDAGALTALIKAAYVDMHEQLADQSSAQQAR